MTPRIRLGINFTQQLPVERLRPWWQAADRAGIAAIGLPDSPLFLREMFVTTAAAALATERIQLITCVSNPVTRHPSVTAAGLLTLDELAPGRIGYGIGTGDSALWTVGERPAKVEELRAYIRAVKGLLRGEEVAWRGRHFAPAWAGVRRPVEVPIYVACSGPKVLAMAAQEADGFFITLGFAPQTIEWITSTIATAAHAVGRDPAALTIWWNAPITFAASRAAAMEESLGWGLNWLSEITTEGKGIPDALKEPIRQFNADNHDLVAVYKQADRGRILVERAKRLGLYDWIMEQSPQLFGTPDDVAARLRELQRGGLTHWMGLQGVRGEDDGTTDLEKMAHIEAVGAVVERLARNP